MNVINKTVIKYSFITLLVTLLLFSGCKKDDAGDPEPQNPDFALEGLGGRIIRQLVDFDNEIFAATDKGLFVKDITVNSGWLARGLTDVALSSFIKINTDYWLAAAYDFDPKTKNFPLYVSTDQGATWTVLENNFGGEDAERINALDYDPDSNTLFAAGTLVIATSTDKGVSWSPVMGDWGAFATGLSIIKYHPDQHAVWTGGQNAIEEFVLIKYNLTSGEEERWTNLLPAPSVSKSILFDSSDPQRILIGAEGGIVETRDGGNSWATLMHRDDSKFFFGLAFDQNDPNTLYAVGWLKNFDTPQELRLYYSTNGGQNWESRTFGSSQLFGGVWNMVSVTENDHQVLYLALYKGGIARIQLNGLAEVAR